MPVNKNKRFPVGAFMKMKREQTSAAVQEMVERGKDLRTQQQKVRRLEENVRFLQFM